LSKAGENEAAGKNDAREVNAAVDGVVDAPAVEADATVINDDKREVGAAAKAMGADVPSTPAAEADATI